MTGQDAAVSLATSVQTPHWSIRALSPFIIYTADVGFQTLGCISWLMCSVSAELTKLSLCIWSRMTFESNSLLVFLLSEAHFKEKISDGNSFLSILFNSPLICHPSFPCLCSLSTLPPSSSSSQMLQKSLKQRRTLRQMLLQRSTSPRMTEAKSHHNLKKAELRVWRITQKQKSKKVALCLPNVKAVRFYLFVIFCVAMIFSCWGSFQREVFWLKL